MAMEMPEAVGIQFAHASLQVVAETTGVELLHIKGPAVDERLLDHDDADDNAPAPIGLKTVARESVDADVLVRPSQVDEFLAVLHRHGWSTAFHFEDGSAFEHAATLRHPFLAPVDLHRTFPGFGVTPEVAFERLWADHTESPIAGYPCAVPSVAGQRLVLLLHAARGGAADHPDIQRSWVAASEDERGTVVALAHDLGADVALAAATGRLDEFEGSRDYALWRLLSEGETSPFRLWVARVRAAPSRRAAARTALKLVVPNPNRLAESLGRRPTRRELAGAYLDRTRWVWEEAVRSARGRRGGAS